MMTGEEQYALKEMGWTIERLAPLELRHKDGSYANGLAAGYVRDAVVEEYFKEKEKKDSWYVSSAPPTEDKYDTCYGCGSEIVDVDVSNPLSWSKTYKCGAKLLGAKDTPQPAFIKVDCPEEL